MKDLVFALIIVPLLVAICIFIIMFGGAIAVGKAFTDAITGK